MAKVVEALDRPDARPLAQQDPRRAALPGVQAVLPEEPGRVLRLLLRLLPARGVRRRSRTRSSRRKRQINEEIDKLRIAATAALFERRDVLIVASVSCIYGLGSPESFGKMSIELKTGARYGLTWYLKRLVEAQYERSHLDLDRGTFRVRGDVLEIHPSYEDTGVRVEFFGDEIEKITPRRPPDGEGPRAARRVRALPEVALRDARGGAQAGARLDRGRARGARRGADGAEEAPRGAAARAADPLRPRDDAGDRLLRRHRELLAPPLGALARASRRRLSSTTSRPTTSRSSTRATRRFPRCARCTTATAPARRRSSSTASDSRRPSTTAR